MAEQKNEVVARTFDDRLNNALSAEALALPKDFNKTRFFQNAIALLQNNEALRKCNQNQLMAGMMRAAYLGLDFAASEAYLAPFGNQVTFIPGYKGLRKFAMKYSVRPIKELKADVIRKDDFIDFGIKDNKSYIEFHPKALSTAEVVGALAVAYYEDGTVSYEVMNMDDLNKVRNSSKCGRSGPWATWTNEMYKKSAIARLAKSITTDFESTEMQSAWNEALTDEFNTTPTSSGEVVNAFAPKTEPEDIHVEAVDVTPEDIPMVENFK